MQQQDTKGNVFYRQPGKQFPLAASGNGVYLQDATGKQYLDGSGGAAVSCLGHGHPDVIEAIRRQSGDMTFAHTLFLTNQPQEQLAARLADRFPEPGARAYFVAGGSEANEAAIKLARAYWLSRDQPGKHLVISRQQSYHGNTLGALSITGHQKRRSSYQPMLHDWPRIEPCYAFRHQRVGEDDEAYGLRSAQALEEAITSAGAENVSAFIAETVVGASIGAVPPCGAYFKHIRQICDRHDVLLILDEVMAGAGRCGSYFSFEQDGVIPDIVTLAKGLAAGYLPLGAMLAREHVHASIRDGVAGFSHGHTYVGHATCCAAGLAVMDVLQRDALIARVEAMGLKLHQALQERFSDHPHVGDLRGRGLLRGVELVMDREKNTPYPAEMNIPANIREAAMEFGLICYPGGSTADGVNGAHILLAPPFIFSESNIDELCEKLKRAMDVVLND